MLALFRILTMFLLALGGKAFGGMFHAENAGLFIGLALGYGLAIFAYGKE